MSKPEESNDQLTFVGGHTKGMAIPCARDETEIASNIVYHAQYSPHFYPLRFDLEHAFYAAAQSVRDYLVQVSLRFLRLRTQFLEFSLIFSDADDN